MFKFFKVGAKPVIHLLYVYINENISSFVLQ